MTGRSGEEPFVLPAAFPNLLANGASGHRGRHGDVDPAAQCRRTLRRRTASHQKLPTLRSKNLCISCLAPIFRPAGVIVDQLGTEILEAYKTGRGWFRVRARWSKAEPGAAPGAVVVTEIPYLVQKSQAPRKDRPN